MHIQCKMCKIAATIITSVYRSTQYCDKRQEFGNTRQGSTKKMPSWTCWYMLKLNRVTEHWNGRTEGNGQSIVRFPLFILSHAPLL